MKKNEIELLEDNRIVHLIISEINGEQEYAKKEWENWRNLVDQNRVRTILREMLTGMLVAEGRCSEIESKNYINNLIEEQKTMNTEQIIVGEKYAMKVGRNEVEVTISEKTEKGWIALTATGKSLTVNNPERFIRRVSAPKVALLGDKKRISLLDAAEMVLWVAPEPMKVRDILHEIEFQNLWKSTSGKTPVNTLSAAINRNAAGENPRFTKAGKGLFTASIKEGEVK